MKKKIFIICLFCILAILLGYYFIAGKNKNNVLTTNEEELFGIINKAEIKLDKFISYANGNIVGVRNNKVGVIKEDGSILVDFIYDDSSFFSYTDDCFIFKKDNKNIVLNSEGKEVLSSEEDIEINIDSISNTSYFILLNDLYDTNGNVIYNNINEYIYIFHDYLILDKEVINFKTNEKFNIIDYEILGDNYLLFYLNNSYKVYDCNTKSWIDYNYLEFNDYNYELSNDTETFIVSREGKIIDDILFEIIDDNYYIDHSVCESGGVLKNSYDEVVINECNDDYDVSLASKNVYIVNDYEEYKSKVIFNDGESKQFDHVVWSAEDYIVSNDLDNGFKLFDLNGNEIETTCNLDFSYYQNGLYICQEDIGSYFVNNDLKKVSDSYDFINCFDDKICFIKKDNLYGIYYEDKVIVEPSYYNIIEENGKIIADKILEYDILTFGKTKELNLKFNEVNFDYDYGIEIGKVISDYQLEEIEDLIYDNDELFQKYAYVVLNNDKLNDFKKEVLDMFKVVVLNKDYLDNSSLFDGLLELSIEKVEDLEIQGAAGAYWNTDEKIKVLTKEKSVVYHELMHFLDYNINNDYGEAIYLCEDEYLTFSEYKDLELATKNTCEEIYINIKSDLLVEAGAEVNMGIYMNEGVIVTYEKPTLIYGALSYLYGDDVLNEIYFSDGGIYTLFKLLRDSGLSFEEYQEFIELVNSTTKINTVISNKDIVKICDYLVRLYSSVKGEEWYNDDYMKYIISSMLFNIGYTASDTENYNDYMKYTILNYDSFFRDILAKIDDDYVLRLLPGRFLYYDDNGYIVIPAYKDNGMGYLKVDYDFEKEIVNGYVYKEYQW